MPRLLIAASGTGGHIFPALSIADSLNTDWHVSWLGVPDRLETNLVPSRYSFFAIHVRGLEGKGFRKLLKLLKLVFATRKVIEIINLEKVQIIFTTGGYIAAPAILAACFCRLPVILHESNAFPGRVTRLLGRFCSIVALGLPNARQTLKGCQTLVTGTPVRSEFLLSQKLPDWVPRSQGPLLVVMGGSQGACGLNLMFRKILPVFLDAGCRIVHLTGSNDEVKDVMKHPNLVEKVFSNDIPSLLQHADLAISRAGAGALSELAISGTPAILVPYPYATDNHQDANAAYAAEYGAAIIVQQNLESSLALEEAIWRILGSKLFPERITDDFLFEMNQGMKRIAISNANKKICELLREQIKK